MEGHVVETVVIEPAFVVVERLAVVAVEDHDRLVHDAVGLQGVEDRLDARVHVRDRAVVLGDDVVLVGDARRHPLRRRSHKRA